MDPALTPEQRMITEGVHRFVRREIWLWEKRIDTNATALPAEVAAALRPKIDEMGLRHIGVPPRLATGERGGPDLDQVSTLRVAMEMSQHRAGVFLPCYGLFAHTDLVALFSAAAEQQAAYLLPLLRGEKRAFLAVEEPSLPGEPIEGVRARAWWKGKEWSLAGTQIFAYGVDQADFGLLLARTEREDGTMGVTRFLVETAQTGFQDWRGYPTLRAGQSTSEINLSNVRVPPERVLGPPHEALALGTDHVLRGRQFIAALCLGVAAQAQAMALAQAWARTEHGRPLAQREDVRGALADSEIEVTAARSLLLQAGAASDRGAPLAVPTAMAKVVAVETAARVVDRAIQVHGSHGASTDLPLERWYRELRLRRLTDGSSAIQRAHVAEHLLSTFRQ